MNVTQSLVLSGDKVRFSLTDPEKGETITKEYDLTKWDWAVSKFLETLVIMRRERDRGN